MNCIFSPSLVSNEEKNGNVFSLFSVAQKKCRRRILPRGIASERANGGLINLIYLRGMKRERAW